MDDTTETMNASNVLFGTYQDKTGKSFCKKCPEGTTTPGRESRSARECSLSLKDNTHGNLVELTIF